MKETTLVYLKILGFLIILYGPVSWFTTNLIYKPGDEYPIADIQGMLIDKDENIIIGDGFYQAILIYNKNGKFMNSWKPETQGGSFKLFLGTDNSIAILPARFDREIYYNLQGVRINAKRAIDTNYAQNYKIIDNMFFPKIVRLNHQDEQVVVEQGFLKNLLKAPFPFFGLSFILIFVFGLISTLKKLNEKNIKSKIYIIILIFPAITLQSCISRLRRPEITGVIVDYAKNPIANCKVGEAVTDKNGRFKLPEQRYNAFFLTEMFAMEAPPLMVWEQVEKNGFVEDAISIYNRRGGGQRKGAEYKIDTIFLRKTNQTFDISALLKNSEWQLGFTKNADTIYMVKNGFKDWCKTDRCSPFYSEYQSLVDNYYSGAKNLPDGMIRRSIDLKFVDEKSPITIIRVQEYISTFEGPNQPPDTTYTKGTYQLLSDAKIILNMGKVKPLSGKYNISQLDLYQMKLIKVK